MLRTLVQLSLQFRALVVVAAAVLIVAGVVVAMRSPLDVFPEFAPPMVEVQTEAPGMSSESVERLVTIPLESALNGLPEMREMRSKSVQGLSQVQMFFERDANIDRARQMIAERVAVAAGQLPQQVKAPRLMPPLSSTSRVLKIGLTPRRVPPELLTALTGPPQAAFPANLPWATLALGGDKGWPHPKGVPLLSQTDLSVLMKWTIEPRLVAIPGVANISTYGQHDRQYQVLINPVRLRDYGLTLDQVKQAARQAAVYASPGYHDTDNQRQPLQYSSRINEPADLGYAPLGKGQSIRLSHVATFATGNPPKAGDGVVNDEPGLLVVVEKYPWANTLQVTREVEEALAVLKPGLPGVVMTTHIFRPATFIEQALGNLRVAMILGCIFVALILAAFLFEWRTAVISLTAIPLSLVSAVVILYLRGETLNTMVLAGLAIAIGEVVDDAIIDVENIVRRLRQNRLLLQPRPAFQVVLDASMEVRSAVVYASFIVVFVCLPIFFLSGVAGAFFRPLAKAYILAVLASLGVALTVTPALCLMLLPRAVDRRRESPLARLVRAIYRRLLPFALNRPTITLSGLVALFVGAAVLYPQLKEEYLPQFQEKDFLMHWVAKPGVSIDTVRDDIEGVSVEMRRDSPVAEFGAHIARAAERGEEVVGSNFAELWISLKDDYGDYANARKEIEAVMARHPGFEYDLLTYLQERIKEVLTGTGASIVLRIYGPNLDELQRKAQQVRQAIEGTDGQERVQGVVDLKVEAQVRVPQLDLVIDPEKARAYNLAPGTVVDFVTTLVNGTKVAEVHQDQKIFDVVVIGHPRYRKSLSDLRRLMIELPSGQGTVPLSAVADLRRINAPNTIRRHEASRFIEVTCNVSGRDLGSTAQEIERRIEPLRKKDDFKEYRIELLGEYKARTENQRQLLWSVGLAVLGIAMLLYLDFRSLRLTLLVMLTLPFALIGGVAAAYITGGVLSLGSLVGFITVLGIAARNGIMMVSHYRHLQAEENMPFGRELILRGAEERVAPVLMTALAAGLGLLPLALSGNKPGYEVEYPMAVVILGGLFTSTLLNLIGLPVLYERFGRTALPAPV